MPTIELLHPVVLILLMKRRGLFSRVAPSSVDANEDQRKDDDGESNQKYYRRAAATPCDQFHSPDIAIENTGLRCKFLKIADDYLSVLVTP